MRLTEDLRQLIAQGTRVLLEQVGLPMFSLEGCKSLLELWWLR